MVKEFGKKHNVNNWILHLDDTHTDSHWKKIWFNAMKNENGLGYFIMDIPKSQRSLNSTNVARFHKKASSKNLRLYVDQDLGLIDKSINAEASLDLNSSQYSSNFWLYKMPKNGTKQKCLGHLFNFPTNSNNKIFCFLLHDNDNIEVFNLHKDEENSDIVLKLHSVWSSNHGFLDWSKDILPR